MSTEQKFTDDELKSLKDLQSGYLEAQSKFGQLVIARINLRKQSDELTQIEDETKQKFVDLQGQEKKLVDELTEKYGEGSLDPKTGVFKSV